MPTTVWHTLTKSETAKELSTSLTQGLTSAGVKDRQHQYGRNELASTPPVPWYLGLARELNDYLVYILVGGAVLSIMVGETVDGLLILVIIAGMAGLGFYQNRKAESALAALKKIVVDKTMVIRDGSAQELAVADLVPGDLVLLHAGDRVPADLRLVEVQNASLDESTLTGESLPIAKSIRPVGPDVVLAERTCLAFSGTEVASGRMRGLVISTGMATELGNIAHLLEATQAEPTPLETQLDKLGRVIGTVLLVVVSLILGLSLYHGTPWLEAVIEAVALAVAAVPEGLPAVITVCLALGTREMAKRQALVRKLRAVEALGSVSVVATDKTGTLTTGQMTVSQVWDANNDLSDTLEVAKLCNNGSDLTEKALTTWVAESKLELGNYPRIAEHEFNSTLKCMTTVHSFSRTRYLVAVKGAPEVILARSLLTEPEKTKVLKHLDAMTGQGLRVLAFARKFTSHRFAKASRDKLENGLEFLGLVGLSDPPKREVKLALKQVQQAGIRPIMITGDNPATASSIARELGFPRVAPFTGAQIDQLSADNELHRLTRYSVFARVTPEHKSLIIQAFQAQGQYIAMIGDGVNDAPSIKLANVGVAMGIRGSDVTRGAADLVLLDDNYATLVAAVEGGRAILNRIRRFVGYLLSCNIAEVGIFLTASLLGLGLPLTPVLLLILNIVTDAAPAISMAVEPADPSLMSRPPRKVTEPVITRRMWLSILWLTLVTTPVVVYAYTLGGVTMAFATLSFLELLRAYTARSLTLSLREIGVFTNSWTTPAVLFGMSVTLAVIYLGGPLFGTTPLPLPLLGLSLALALVGPIAEELAKPALKQLL